MFTGPAIPRWDSVAAMRARWASLPRWKWLVPTAVVALYIIGAQPIVDFSQSCDDPVTIQRLEDNGRLESHQYCEEAATRTSAGGEFRLTFTRRLALYLALPRVRVFDVDFASGRALGFGLSATP